MPHPYLIDHLSTEHGQHRVPLLTCDLDTLLKLHSITHNVEGPHNKPADVDTGVVEEQPQRCFDGTCDHDEDYDSTEPEADTREALAVAVARVRGDLLAQVPWHGYITAEQQQALELLCSYAEGPAAVPPF